MGRGPAALIVVACMAAACTRGRRTPDPAPTASAPGTTAASASPSFADPNFHVFLLLGQSNMWGVPPPEAKDREAHPRVKVLAYEDCPALGRRYGEWAPAVPPLHACKGGVGPGDGFGRRYAEARPGITVGLVPLGVGGAKLALFRKGVVADNRSEFRLPPDDRWKGGYEWIVDRALLAQRSGAVRGILLHQGESDAHFNTEWEHQVAALIAHLRRDLALGEKVPLVAGELLETGCCGAFNAHVRALPHVVPNASVASSAGLTGTDVWHFDLPSQRALGRRYAERMLALVPP